MTKIQKFILKIREMPGQ